MKDGSRQELWVPGKMPGLNELIAAAKGARGRGYMYSKIKKQWRATVMLLARSQGIKPIGSAEFVFTWKEARRNRDKDNIAAGGRKLIFDGLVSAGVLVNDGWNQIDGWEDRFVVSSEPGVLVEILASS